MTITEELPPTTPKAPKKKAAAKRAKKRGAINKSAFIRSTAGSAKEVVEAAKAKGIELDEKLVYTVRSNAEKKKSKKNEKKGAPTKKRGPGRPKGSTNKPRAERRTNAASAGADQAWITEAFAMGLDRAIKVLTTIRAALA